MRGLSVAPDDRPGAPEGPEQAGVPSLSPKGQRTRRRLVQGARQAFEHSGSYVDTRIADIVRESGVAYGSFYTYFDSKEELFHELAVTVVDELYADSTSAYRGADPVERIESANRRLLTSYRRHATMLAVIDQAAALYPGFRTLRQQLRERFVARIAGSLRKLIAQGRAGPGEHDRQLRSALERDERPVRRGEGPPDARRALGQRRRRHAIAPARLCGAARRGR